MLISERIEYLQLSPTIQMLDSVCFLYTVAASGLLVHWPCLILRLSAFSQQTSLLASLGLPRLPHRNLTRVITAPPSSIVEATRHCLSLGIYDVSQAHGVTCVTAEICHQKSAYIHIGYPRYFSYRLPKYGSVPQPHGIESSLSCAIFKVQTGVVGFEPTNIGAKIRCLTTWRHPFSKSCRTRTNIKGFGDPRVTSYTKPSEVPPFTDMLTSIG